MFKSHVLVFRFKNISSGNKIKLMFQSKADDQPTATTAVPKSDSPKKVSLAESAAAAELKTGPSAEPSNLSWVDKYKPTSLKHICGQQGDKSCVQKLVKWLKHWHKNNADPTVKRRWLTLSAHCSLFLAQIHKGSIWFYIWFPQIKIFDWLLLFTYCYFQPNLRRSKRTTTGSHSDQPCSLDHRV